MSSYKEILCVLASHFHLHAMIVVYIDIYIILSAIIVLSSYGIVWRKLH